MIKEEAQEKRVDPVLSPLTIFLKKENAELAMQAEVKFVITVMWVKPERECLIS